MAYNSCATISLAGFDSTCDESRASIKRVLLCPKDKVDFYKQSDKVIQVFPISYHRSDTYDFRTDPFVEFRFRRNTGSYTSTYTGDNATGSQVVTTEVSLQFSKAENQKRLEFQKLTGHPCVMIIEDNYGQYVVLGVDSPIVLTNTVMQSGTAKSDLSGFTLTFTEESYHFPLFLQTDYDVNSLLVSHKSTTIYSSGQGFVSKYFEGTPSDTITGASAFGKDVQLSTTSPYPYMGKGSQLISPYVYNNFLKNKTVTVTLQRVNLNGNTFGVQVQDSNTTSTAVTLSYTLNTDAFDTPPLYVMVSYTASVDISHPPYSPKIQITNIIAI